MDPSDPRLQAGLAVAGSLAPLAGPWGIVAGQVLTTGLAFWAEFARKQAAGELTEADVREAAEMTSVDLDDLRAEVEAREASGR